jgi:large conductance mechanosensitive channel
MGMLAEFKEFAMKGNVVDLAIGVVIGTAFGKIVSSIVADVFMPILSIFTKGINFSNLAYTITPAVIGPDGKETAAAVAIKYGAFLQTVIDFVIIAFVLFMVIKVMNRLKKAEAAAPAPPPAQEVLLTEIRDLLKKG